MDQQGRSHHLYVGLGHVGDGIDTHKGRLCGGPRKRSGVCPHRSLVSIYDHAHGGFFDWKNLAAQFFSGARKGLVSGFVSSWMLPGRNGFQSGGADCKGRRRTLGAPHFVFYDFGLGCHSALGQIAGRQYHCHIRVDLVHGYGTCGVASGDTGYVCKRPGPKVGKPHLALHSLRQCCIGGSHLVSLARSTLSSVRTKNEHVMLMSFSFSFCLPTNSGGVVAENAQLLFSTTAAGGVGLIPIIVSAVLGLHTVGFLAGYLVPRRVFKFGERTSRTISIETGMQNSALAVVLARSIGAPSITSLPGALSATAHSCLGSILAAYWRGVDKRDDDAAEA